MTKKTLGGWAVPEPDYDPTTAPPPEPNVSEGTDEERLAAQKALAKRLGEKVEEPKKEEEPKKVSEKK
jgi:hypothetical protein